MQKYAKMQKKTDKCRNMPKCRKKTDKCRNMPKNAEKMERCKKCGNIQQLYNQNCKRNAEVCRDPVGIVQKFIEIQQYGKNVDS